MYFQSKLGKLGETFTTYKEFIDLTNKQPYADTMSHLRKLPSSQCTSCSKLKDCYGGCPVLWKNYSFNSLKDLNLIDENMSR